MASITLGKITLTTEPDGVTLTVDGNPPNRVRIPAHDLQLMERFLREHAPEERRLGFRVPIGPINRQFRARFTVSIPADGRRQRADPVDLSLTGILLAAAELDIEAGAQVTVTLQLERYGVRLKGLVVRVATPHVAVHFVDCLKNGELDPPSDLLAIYRELETQWLKSRIV